MLHGRCLTVVCQNLEEADAVPGKLKTQAVLCLKIWYQGKDLCLIIHISYIHDKFDIELEVIPHNATEYISCNIIPGMAQMSIAIDRRPASIPSDFSPSESTGMKAVSDRVKEFQILRGGRVHSGWASSSSHLGCWSAIGKVMTPNYESSPQGWFRGSSVHFQDYWK
ncbi:hypothetical protein H112_07896 [Trichophyton rubrum D6]|uniref:Uncharacterized protein n=2 Tax=Trichophyton TaxID=5550 RepID=A0A022VQT1_TRIRU|nr:hypothetical protein H100_07923 [Trichophyton rubrum MR850]EZF37861.1 hypothetical protein H102_07883 [Trichophyton rubrum CBS 100081]EZF48425.1 hypothetical protein H103_07908 [Trichophyton rubrum CBS 288.86]EZF59121.1 hypothetical protein H104_07855 [Trichophyton rubrum CBS 289.86]EZF69678.1 hypothetical protein H105_07909 [Trichophyton soudanense CBS 452.61]EZF80384.1 hypothetical protein H110_07907 [Trichophyton rubrum MR1448]EZF91004.1 hypothetical protein H113_07970 [Trichophyton rub